MKHFSTSPREMIASFWRNRGLIAALTRREVIGRYRGSMLGILWSFFNPLFMLAVYTFVFSFVFQGRWNTGSGSRAEFALVLFAGLLVFNLFAECVNRAPSLILANINYVKKVVFPLEILPWIILGSALFHALVSLSVWLLFYIIVFGMPHATILLLPVILLPLALMTMGVSWLLAALGVYLRDMSQIIGLVVTTLMFLSPIFYPLSAVPEKYRIYLNFNPLTPVLEQARNVLMWSEAPGWPGWCAYIAVSALIAWMGFAWFQKTRRGFADVV